MSEAGKAVFLSYASQDAEAARQICESLRQGGVEVWFDADGGLEHGDEWDAKIRKQIKECVLFIPIISANTQAREEGYFRLEWDLAAERARTIASGVPFILPVVIDDTREPAALVPDRFRLVQWTRLPGGVVPPEVQQRFLKLWSHRAGLLRHQAAQPDVEAGRPRSAGLGSSFSETLPDTTAPVQSGAGWKPRGRHWWVIGTVVLLLGAGIFWPKLRRTEAPTAVHPSQPPTAAEKPAATASPADDLVARAYALIEKMNYTRDNLAIAEDLTRRATELATDSARAWAARAYMQACYILRGWDTGEKRRQDTQAYAQRALALDPNAVEALLASGYLLNSQQAYAQAEVVLRRAIALRPDDSRAHRSLMLAVGRQGREDEAITMGQEIVRLFPRDSLAHYGLAGGYLARADFAAALASYEAAIAVEPFAGALLAKVTLQSAWRGDLAAARATLGQLAPEDRTEDRAVGVAMWLGLLERQPARVHAAAALTARTYLDDSLLLARGPKAAGTALAYHLDQKEGLARQHWQAAEAVLRQRLRDRPETSADHAWLATVLAWLGRTEEATREIAAFEALAREQPSINNSILLARFYATMGDATKAVPYLRQALNRHHAITNALLPLDPWWDKLRGQPGFTVLLGEAKPRAAAAPETRSVAVLPFANQSDDKANESFADGISEELGVVLSKVPGLRVTGWNSALAFKGKSVPEAEIAQKLGVTHIVSGSVQKIGTQVRITARLVNAADSFSLWSESFRREAKDIFAVQDEIAALIAQKLQLQLGVESRRNRTVNPEAHRLMLEGRHFWNQRNEAGFTRAEKAFLQAIDLDPTFAEAHAGLAGVYVVRADYQPLPSTAPRVLDDTRRARNAAEKAVALNRDLAEAHAVLAYVKMIQGERDGTDQSFARALALNPQLPVSNLWYAVWHKANGRLDVALESFRKVEALDPLWFINLHLYSEALFYAGRHDEALRTAERAASLRPDIFVPNLGLRAQLLFALGRRDEALQVARSIRQNKSTDTRWYADGSAIRVIRLCGNAAEAREFSAEVLQTLDQQSPMRSQIHAAEGDFEGALATLSEARMTHRRYYFWEPCWDQWRNDPRFHAAIAKLGCMPEYQTARETLARLKKEPEAKK